MKDIELALVEGAPHNQQRQAVKAAYLWAWDRFFESRTDLRPSPPNLDSPKLKREIDKALAYQGLVVVCGAVRGLFHSPHHVGANDRGELYLDISYALRPSNMLRMYYLWRQHRPDREGEMAEAGGVSGIVERLAERAMSTGRVPSEIVREVLALAKGEEGAVEAALLRLDRRMLDAVDASLEPPERVTVAAVESEELATRETTGRQARDRALRRVFHLPTLSLDFDPSLVAPAPADDPPPASSDPPTWEALAPLIREEVGPEEWEVWFAPLRASQPNGILLLKVPNTRFLHTLEEDYRGAMDRAAERLPEPVRYRFELGA